jgi:Undecaprenyl-phosphate galactose phosphotransferase WbaP
MSELSTSTLLPAAEVVLAPEAGQASAARLALSERSRKRRAQRRLMSRLALMMADVVVIQAAMVLAGLELVLLQGSPTSGSPWSPVLGAAVALAALVPSAALGLHDAAGLSPLERFRMRVYVAAMLPWLGLALVSLVQPVTLEVITLLGATALLSVPLALLAEAYVRQMLIARSAWGADVLVIGSGAAAKRIASDLLAHPETGLRPIGYCGDPSGAETSPQIPRMGSLADLEITAGTADIGVVVLSSEVRGLDFARLPFDRIIIVPNDSDIPAVGAKTRALGGVAGFDLANPARANSNQFGKRVLDLLVAVPALLVALPVILCTALAIRLISPGPAFYVQHRVGWKGRSIPIFKLRSMYRDADRRLEELLRNDPAARKEWDTHVKLSRDPRILPIIGNFIRKTSIDELPQLWNVVRGDISLVGPRPFPAYHVEKFRPEFQRLRCSVRPGLTGLWQVSIRNGADLRQQEEIDTFYIRNWSLWLDFYIVFRTLPAVLSARGAR